MLLEARLLVYGWDGGRGTAGANMSSFGSELLFVSPGGPPPTVANCSEGPTNWVPGAGGLDERVPITLVHESLVMSLRDQLGGFQEILPDLGNDPTSPDLLYLIVMVSVVGVLSPYGLFSVTFTRGLEVTGRLAVFGVTPPSQRRPRDQKGPTSLTTKGSR